MPFFEPSGIDSFAHAHMNESPETVPNGSQPKGNLAEPDFTCSQVPMIAAARRQAVPGKQVPRPGRHQRNRLSAPSRPVHPRKLTLRL